MTGAEFSQALARYGVAERGNDIRAAREQIEAHDAAQRQEIEDLRKQLSESVPRSRYDACNQDWLDAKAKLEQVQQAASKEIAQLEGRVQALEGALKGFLRFKTLVGYDEYRKAQAALAATGEDQHGGNN